MFGGIVKEEIMRLLGTTATVFALLLAGGARCEERGEGRALNKELQPLQGGWAAVSRAGGWQMVLSISRSSATLVCVNDEECLEVMITVQVEVCKAGGKQVLVLRNLTLPKMVVNNAALPSVVLPGVSIEIPYRLRRETLLAGRAELKIAGVPLFIFRVPGGEMRRAFPSSLER
jgi:hypothetical protein